MVNLSEIFQHLLNTNEINGEIFASIFTFLVVALAGWLTYFVFGRYFSSWAAKLKITLADDILRAIRTILTILIIIVGIQYALSTLSFFQPYSEQLSAVFRVLEILLGAFVVTRVTNALADWYSNRNDNGAGRNNRHLLFFLKKLVQLTVYIFAFLIILYVFNIDLTGVIVGLGVGGIAIAFALQNTLSDFFSAFSIYFDRPFEIGDFIVVGNYSGTVKNIGVKSTRIKLLQGEELVISNKELTSTSVRNFRKLEKRRVTFTIGVSYNTPLVKLKRIPRIIEEIIKGLELAKFDRVNFTEFGSYSLIFLVIYYVASADYGKYLETQEAINFAIKEAFEKEEIEIAFPTSTVYIKN
ncbi:MAG: mechanosensitive ion channel family protein [Candidatus Bathyarchaeota archaeon]|nr:mechanosensitive ion channel family protein [Candidatus Bathyarchaeota archaeon]